MSILDKLSQLGQIVLNAIASANQQAQTKDAVIATLKARIEELESGQTAIGQSVDELIAAIAPD